MKPPPEPCLLCGSTANVEAHHMSRRPFDVVWLCASCHSKYHQAKSQSTQARRIREAILRKRKEKAK